MSGVYFGPNTFCSSRTKLLQPGLCVMCLFLTVNPSVAKCYIKCFCIGDGLFSRIFLEYFEPQPGGAIVIFFEPRFECPGRFKCHYWKGVGHVTMVFTAA